MQATGVSRVDMVDSRVVTGVQEGLKGKGRVTTTITMGASKVEDFDGIKAL